MKVAMLLLAAGRGSRFGGPVPKAWLPLDGRPLLLCSAERLVRAVGALHAFELIVLVHPDDRATHVATCLPALQRIAGQSPLRVVDGGDSRQQSVQNGLLACSPATELVLVHDAARPLPPIAATIACLDAAARHGCAMLAVPVPDTLKQVRDGLVRATLDRSDVWLAQTPQVVRRELLERAFAHAIATSFEGTDDVSLVEHLGAPVAVVPGTATNFKITRSEDLGLAAALLAANLQ